MILEPSINCQEGMMKLFQQGKSIQEVNLARVQRGQGMTEYIVIVALVAVAAIGVYSMLGQTIRNQTAGLALEIAGQTTSAAAITAAKTSADSAATKADTGKNLATYNVGNQ
jgi:Flp pilus assembly pilin Flp